MTPEEEEKPFDVEKYIREKKAGRMSVVDEPLTALSLKKTLEMARRFLILNFSETSSNGRRKGCHQRRKKNPST